ncbi:hypothetical protein CPT_Moby_255 [Stenotrophomonas phage Moby]|uniref:Uncharacterized protein n=1 Tax=Stenotrophomonas phage Moby TaxID=2601680 RepID=A0A5P8PPB5_9CAUD|nr:hypothetical protein HWC58_gp143 [Stenotrophomonas phage Moby]QFR57980.1 hypothetical protein CPT_Moby_255 [Stenotrophomonas phage Moby]
MHPIDLSQELQTMINLIEDAKDDAIKFLLSDDGWDMYGIYRDKYADQYRGLASQVEKAICDREDKIAQLQEQIAELLSERAPDPTKIPPMTVETCHRIFLTPLEVSSIKVHFPDVWKILEGGYLAPYVDKLGAWELWNCKTAENWNTVMSAVQTMIDDGRLPDADA